ncbi:hypothetical protein [Microbulbifer variabilis]|uniref:hypothetical protein n=1 Tax=Microbulbifer variabilis TaxID=266805 RepID=UPI001CFC8B0C|nr:hypothetical protein [Microbulbifer variabilis]
MTTIYQTAGADGSKRRAEERKVDKTSESKSLIGKVHAIITKYLSKLLPSRNHTPKSKTHASTEQLKNANIHFPVRCVNLGDKEAKYSAEKTETPITFVGKIQEFINYTRARLDDVKGEKAYPRALTSDFNNLKRNAIEPLIFEVSKLIDSGELSQKGIVEVSKEYISNLRKDMKFFEGCKSVDLRANDYSKVLTRFEESIDKTEKLFETYRMMEAAIINGDELDKIV